MKKRNIVFTRSQILRNVEEKDVIKSGKVKKVKTVKTFENNYPHTNTKFHPLGYYFDGGIDPDRVTDTHGNQEYDTAEELGSNTSNAWCNPRVDSMDIAEHLSSTRQVVDVAPNPNPTEPTPTESTE